MDGRVAADNIRVEATGDFRVEVEAPRLPGDVAVAVEQQENLRLNRDQSSFRVITADRKR
jgi:hypothetical protein